MRYVRHDHYHHNSGGGGGSYTPFWARVVFFLIGISIIGGGFWGFIFGIGFIGAAIYAN